VNCVIDLPAAMSALAQLDELARVYHPCEAARGRILAAIEDPEMTDEKDFGTCRREFGYLADRICNPERTLGERQDAVHDLIVLLKVEQRLLDEARSAEDHFEGELNRLMNEATLDQALRMPPK